MKNKEDERKMRELVDWFNQDFQTWVEGKKVEAEQKRAQMEAEGKAFFFSPPTERDYAKYRLGVDPASFSRWKSLLNPINDVNLLAIVMNTGSTRPLEIFGLKDLAMDNDLAMVIAGWKSADRGSKKAISRIAKFGVEDDDFQPSHNP